MAIDKLRVTIRELRDDGEWRGGSGELRVVAIVNPASGRSRGARLRAAAVGELQALFPGLTVVETERPGHGAELARAAREADLVVAVGGDGTTREVCSGLAGARSRIALVPTGSGNDLTKTLGIPEDVAEACRVARDGAPGRLDAVRLTSLSDTGSPAREEMFVNVAGFGFDAAVVDEASRLRSLSGLPLYTAAVFRAVRNLSCPRVKIRTGGREWIQPILLLAAANGRIYGGGMKIAPDARADDGLLDVCIIGAVGRFTVLRRLPQLIAGTHGRLRETTLLRVAWIELEFLDPCPVQLDGDLFRFSERRLRVEVLPGVLNIMLPRR